MLESEDGLGFVDSVRVMLYGSTEEYYIMWRYWKFMVKNLMYFLAVIADSWVAIILTYLSMWMDIEYPYSSNSSQSGKKCIGSHECFVYRLEIALSCYCVRKWSKKIPLLAEKKDILKCILWHSSTIAHLQIVVFTPEREHNGVIS